MDNSLKKRRKELANHACIACAKRRLRAVLKDLDSLYPRPICHIYAQLIDDENAMTLAGIGTLSKANQTTDLSESRKMLREKLESKLRDAKKQNINSVIFDRGRYKFHGVVAELANGAREAGLQF